MPTCMHLGINPPVLFLEFIKLQLILLPEEDVLNDLYACNSHLWKSLFKSSLNLLPTRFDGLHFVLCGIIVCKVVFDNISPVGREVPLLKIRKFFRQPSVRIQVISSFDCNLIIVWDFDLGKRDTKHLLTDSIEVLEVLIVKGFDGSILWEVVFVIFEHSPDFFLCNFYERLGACYHDLVICFSCSWEIGFFGLFIFLVRWIFEPVWKLCLCSLKFSCCFFKSENSSLALVLMCYVFLLPSCILKSSTWVLPKNFIKPSVPYHLCISSDSLMIIEALFTFYTHLIEYIYLPVLVRIIEYAWIDCIPLRVVGITWINCIRPPSIEICACSWLS
jgi:hypothetical protein